MYIRLKRLFFKVMGFTPAKMEMVSYWKKSGAVQAKVTEEDGVTVMKMEGEKYTFPGFPRGWLLFGKLSKLKHEVKNQIFNNSWAKLEEGISEDVIVQDIKQNVLPNIYELFEETKYDIIPPQKMVPAVREIYRAWKKIAPNSVVCDIVTMILQEDDSYRFRCQDMAQYFNPNLWWKQLRRFITRRSYLEDIIKDFETALNWIEQAEIIGDMKERQRLFRRIILTVLKDEYWGNKFVMFCKEVNWKKIYLTKADKYFFRGKYYKVDLDKFEY